MNKFINNTINQNIKEAICLATDLLTHESKMIDDVMNKNDFKYNSGTGEEVAQKLLRPLPPIKVNTYRPWNPWTKAIGYYDGTGIYINVRALEWMTVTDITANLIHEYSHYAGFGHGNNYKTNDKVLFSVPYYLSENISRWL